MIGCPRFLPYALSIRSPLNLNIMNILSLKDGVSERARS